MTSYLYKPEAKKPEIRKKINHEFQALQGSSIVTSINAIKVPKKSRRYTDHFKEEQDLDSSVDSQCEKPDQEGSSTSDDS